MLGWTDRLTGCVRNCIRRELQDQADALFDFARTLGQPGEEGVNLLAYRATDLHVFAFPRIVLG